MSAAPFQLYAWPQRSLVIAPSHASLAHRHHAAQIALGLDGQVIFETPNSKRYQADLLLIPPDTLHAHPAFGPAAMLFLEPEGIELAKISAGLSGELIKLPFDEQLRGYGRAAASGDARAAQRLSASLVGDSIGMSATFDPLIRDACEFIARNLQGRISQAALAKAVQRSPSRLAHRFREATGVPIRRFVLWSRLRAATQSAMRGESLTMAAHAAGFSDSAHLSRTFLAMFGISPSLMFSGGRVEVTFLDEAGLVIETV